MPDNPTYIHKLTEILAEEQRRHERVIDRIVELKAETAARAVKIVLPDPKPSVELPDGVSLQPGLLTISSFQNDQQLLERLLLLARVLATQPQVLNAVSLPASFRFRTNSCGNGAFRTNCWRFSHFLMCAKPVSH